MITQTVITMISNKNFAPAIKNIITMSEAIIQVTDGRHEGIMSTNTATHTIKNTVW
jgi:hypothetical protein